MKRHLILLLCALMTLPCYSQKWMRKNRNRKKEQKTEKPAPPKKADDTPQTERHGMIDAVKIKGEWYFDIPETLLDKDLLTTTRYTSTPADCGKFGGEMCNRQVVCFSLTPDSSVTLRAKMYTILADTAETISRAVDISNGSPIIGAFKVEKKKDGKLRIKVQNFLNDDNALGIPTSLRSGFGITQMARDLCYVEDIKTFPTNTEVRVVKTYNSNKTSLPAAAWTGKVTFGLNISFVMLPEEPMQPRFYDPRVGYFTERFREFTDDQQRVESKTYISRWRLEPRPEDVEKMRNGELVEPVKPIVFYIDPATPKQWRKYLIMGVNDWQVAFEQAGFKNAIRAEEWPEGEDSTMSMEDARYSVIRYLASPIANAYGPHVSDPRTGEILESHIGWYHNVMTLLHDWYMVQASSIDEAARKMNYDEELMGQLIRFVSSHEVGHTLGLRHNFGSSSTVPVDSLRDKAWVEAHGHTPSIMDYARFNYVAQPEDKITTAGIFPRINDYDKWAIRWGYTPMPDAQTPLEDHQMMEKMTREAQKEKRLWWGDGEGVKTDPRRQTEDLGDDAVKASTYGIKNLKRELAYLAAWTKEDKDIYGDNLQSMYSQIMRQYKRYMGHVGTYIGGTYMTWRTPDEGGTAYEPTPLAKQKESLNFLNGCILQEPTWFREPSYAKSLASDPRDLTLELATYGAQLLVSRISQLNALYPAEDYLTDIVRLSFTEAQSGAKVTKYRETLQNTMVNSLISAFGAQSGSNRGNILQALKDIQKKAQSYAGSDAHTKAHYANLADLIARTLVIK